MHFLCTIIDTASFGFVLSFILTNDHSHGNYVKSIQHLSTATPCPYYFGTNETDVKDEKITLTDGELKFVGKSEDKDYEVNIEFFNTVDAEGSTYKVLPRSVQMHILKKDVKEDDEFWPRLLKDKALEKNQVKIDWDRYVDEGKFS